MSTIMGMGCETRFTGAGNTWCDVVICECTIRLVLTGLTEAGVQETKIIDRMPSSFRWLRGCIKRDVMVRNCKDRLVINWK